MLLCDGQDDTVYTFKRGKPGTLTVTLPEGARARQIYIRLADVPATVTQKQQNAAGKYEVITQVSSPAPSFVLETAAAGDVQLEIAGVNNAPVTLRELRFFGEGALPAEVRAFRTGGTADICMCCPPRRTRI